MMHLVEKETRPQSAEIKHYKQVKKEEDYFAAISLITNFVLSTRIKWCLVRMHKPYVTK